MPLVSHCHREDVEILGSLLVISARARLRVASGVAGKQDRGGARLTIGEAWELFASAEENLQLEPGEVV